MSLNLIRNNSSSPFHLQRSIVDQGGEDGAYESGGYDPNNVYSDNGVSDAIASFGKILGAGIQSRTAEDKNNSNVKKEARLKDREKKIDKKTVDAFDKGDDNKVNRLMKRHDRVDARLKDTKSDIKKYNESQKPTLTSDLKTTSKKEDVKPVENSAVADKVNKDRQSSVTTTTASTSNLVDQNKNPSKNTWSDLVSKFKIG